MNKYNNCTNKELIEEEKRIRKSCASWENSTDGSHGMALHNAGINDVLDEMEKRKGFTDD